MPRIGAASCSFSRKCERSGAYIGTEAACALSMHAAKIAAYGIGDLLSVRVIMLAVVLTPATLAGAWAGKRITDRMTDRLFTRLMEIGLLIAGILFIIGV